MSSADDIVMIKFRTEGGAVDLDLLGSLDIIAWKGNTAVDTLDWQNGIINGVNVLNLLSNNQMVELPYAPGAEYDRISVGISTLVGAGVFPPVRSEEHTSELQSRGHLVCRLLLEKKKTDRSCVCSKCAR